MIVADTFSGMAKAAEDAAKDMDISYLNAHHEELLHAYGQLADMLKAALQPDTPADEPCRQEQEDAISISSEELCEKLSELACCLKTFEADRAEDILNTLNGVNCDGQDVSGALADIRSDIEEFEMDAAENKVQTLIAQLKAQTEPEAQKITDREKGGEVW